MLLRSCPGPGPLRPITRLRSALSQVRLSRASDTWVRCKPALSLRTDGGQQPGGLETSSRTSCHLRVTHCPQPVGRVVFLCTGPTPALHAFLVPLPTEQTDLSVSHRGRPSIIGPAGEQHVGQLQ